MVFRKNYGSSLKHNILDFYMFTSSGESNRGLIAIELKRLKKIPFAFTPQPVDQKSKQSETKIISKSKHDTTSIA